MTVGSASGVVTPAFNRAAALLLAVLIAALLAACATPEERERRVDTSGRIVTLTLGSANSIELRQDQELQVRLATKATTGHVWSLVEMTSGVLAQQGTSSFERESLVSNIGQAAGFEVFRFKPVAAGATTLKFELRRPRDLDPAIQLASFAVSVR
jgi:predicted secreted protein